MSYQIYIGAISSSNPALWVDASTLDSDVVVYEISSSPPSHDDPWFFINQFCSVLSIYWLKHNPALPFGLNDVTDNEKIAMAEQLISYESMDQQAAYAADALNGEREETEHVVYGVSQGTFPVGTRIWAGNDNHVVAVRIDSPQTFQLYDSNTGRVTTFDRQDFAEIINGLQCDAFVVASNAKSNLFSA